MKKWYSSEKDIAAVVVEYLQCRDWEIYQEVCAEHSQYVADIVAVKGTVCWIVETKTCFNMSLLAQLGNWSSHAHYVSGAYPSAKTSDSRSFGKRVAKSHGFGLLEVRADNIYEAVRPTLNRSAIRHGSIKKILTQDHKTFCSAGSARGGYWTPFKETCRAITQYVKENPGCGYQDVINGVSTHYSSRSTFKSCLMRYILKDVIDEIYIDATGKKHRLFLKAGHRI